jgi:hypothetical protein
MISYKNTNSNAGSIGLNGFHLQTQFNPQVRKANVETTKARGGRSDFEAIVLECMSALQEGAEASHNVVLKDFLKSLKNQLSKKNPDLNDILKFIESTRI